MTAGKAFLYLVYGVIVAGLVIAIIASFGKSAPAPQQPQSNTSSQQQANSQSKAKTTPNAATPGQSATPKPTSTPSNTPSQLNNTGPGDVAGLFILVSIVGLFGYRRFIVRGSTA